jgi:AcrR family transcriptional regulator
VSPRPRTVTDEAIIAAAATVIGRLGPGKLTLAGVGKEIGLSAATLVQRFGSKRGLLPAMPKSAADSVDDCLEMVRAAHQSWPRWSQPRPTSPATSTRLRRWPTTGRYCRWILSDPDFHRLMDINSKKQLEGYRRLVQEAIDASELVECDTQRLVRALTSVCGGSLLGPCSDRDPPPPVDTVLEPYRLRSPRASRARQSMRRSLRRAQR